MDYHAATQNDAQAVAGLAQKLWPGHSISELKEEFAFLLAGQEVVLVLALDGGSPIGFAQCQLRHDYVEGTSGGPVAYLEGIFVERAYRGLGVARELLRRCEAWGRAQGCREMASDCTLDNTASEQFHRHTGFEEANRLICFVKPL